MRVLGLDISSHAVACIEMDTAFGRFEIRETHETSVDPMVMNSMGAAQQLVRSLSKKADKVVTAVPVEMSTFRNLQLGTKDKKAIRAALEFELEDDLPFERENLQYDSVIMGAGPQGSQIHVGAVKRGSFETYVNDLLSFDLDADIITTDAWAYRCLFTRLNARAENAEPLLLIGLEYDKTFFYVHHKNRPVLYREIPFGMQTIEQELKKNLGANNAEIKNWIQDIGVSEIDVRVSTAIAEALELLVPELKQTELAARSTLKASIDQIYVTGEGALMPGFLKWLEEATYRQVSLFRPLSQISPGHVTYSDLTETRFAKSLALAMVTIPLDKLSPINLRKGLFSKISAAAASTMDLITKPLPYVIVVLLVFFATKTIEHSYYQSKSEEADDTLKRAVKVYFGGASDSLVRTHLASPEKLKKTVQMDLSKERELSKLFSPNINSPFDFLKNLSQKIGKDIVLDMVHFEAGADNTEAFKEGKALKASAVFIVANAQMLAKLSDILEKSFGLKRGHSEEVSQDGRKLLKVAFSGTIGGAK